MSARSALEELRCLSTITEQCMAQALVARRQLQSYGHHYRAMADLFRTQAARSRFPEIRDRLLRVAESNERLASIAEPCGDVTEDTPQIKSRANLYMEEAPNRGWRLQDRLASSATIYLDTAAIIEETRHAIESSVRRIGPRSHLGSEMAPDPLLASQSASEARSKRTIASESRRDAVRNTPDEDPVAQSRRHVWEAEAHIARQEALIERLSHDDKLAALARQAREILDTLKQTRNLAREHLALELRERSGTEPLL